MVNKPEIFFSLFIFLDCLVHGLEKYTVYFFILCEQQVIKNWICKEGVLIFCTSYMRLKEEGLNSFKMYNSFYKLKEYINWQKSRIEMLYFLQQ